MKELRQFLITIVSALPFARFILKALYLLALKRAKALVEAFPEIQDIYLLSNLEDKNFVYGQSDLNLLVILSDHSRPKAALKDIRKFLRQNWLASALIDLNRLPILKESELKTPVIRSYLVTSSKGELVRWQSIATGERIQFKVGEQGQFAKRYFYIQRLETYLFKEVTPRTPGKHWIRSYGKNVSRALEGMEKELLLPAIKDAKWKKQGSKLFGFSPFARIYYQAHQERTWRILDTKHRPCALAPSEAPPYPQRLMAFAGELEASPIVEDVLFIPSLLQSSERIKGKVFIDIVLGGSQKPINKKDLQRLQRSVDRFTHEEAKEPEQELKTEFNFTTLGLLELRHKKALFPYPLEGWYRKNRGFSLKGRRYNFEIEKSSVEKAMIHFLLLQFMRFRSQKLANSLVGSKFIKSLNLMNRYELVLASLTGEELKIPEKYSDMMLKVTPQLARCRPQTIVEEEDWPLIKSQLVYSLKKIRDELAKKRPNLKNLQF